MRETEIKLKYDSSYRDTLLKKCKDAGFVEEDRVKESDLYYTPVHKNLMLCDQALRLRSVVSLKKGEKHIVTYKGKNQSDIMHSREELETEVGNGSVFQAILKYMDFSELTKVEKDRVYFRKDNIHICVDDVKRLGSYFEIEILGEEKAEQRIQDLLNELDIPNAKQEVRTYLELILKEEGNG